MNGPTPEILSLRHEPTLVPSSVLWASETATPRTVKERA